MFFSFQHAQVAVEQRFQIVQRPVPAAPLGMIFATCVEQDMPDTCLILSLNHTIDDIKDEIQRFCGIAPERQGLHFSTYGAQRRSVRRRIEVLPNMYLVRHMLEDQFGGRHVPVIGEGWRIDCQVWDLGPRRFRISCKRPVFHDYNDNNDNKRLISDGGCESGS